MYEPVLWVKHGTFVIVLYLTKTRRASANNAVPGKLAHTFMLFYLVSISCYLDMINTLMTEINAKTNINPTFTGKQKHFRESQYSGFPN